MTGNYSSRKIEEACKNDIRFMWILDEEPRPDHSTIARFQNEKSSPVIKDLFYQFINKLCEIGEVGFENVFIDGTKIEANANRHTFVWKKSVEYNIKKLAEKISMKTPEIAQRYGYPDEIQLENLLSNLEINAKFEGVSFVYGRGKRKNQSQKVIEELKDYRDRMANYEEKLLLMAGRNSYSKTDKDATFMRLKDDHMKTTIKTSI